MSELPTFAEFVDFIGLPQVREAEQRYAVGTAPQTEPQTGAQTGASDGGDI